MRVRDFAGARISFVVLSIFFIHFQPSVLQKSNSFQWYIYQTSRKGTIQNFYSQKKYKEIVRFMWKILKTRCFIYRSAALKLSQIIEISRKSGGTDEFWNVTVYLQTVKRIYCLYFELISHKIFFEIRRIENIVSFDVYNNFDFTFVIYG